MRRFRNSSQKRYLGSTVAAERIFLRSWLMLVRIQTVTGCCTRILPLNGDIYCTCRLQEWALFMCRCFPVIQLLQWRVQTWHCDKEFCIEASRRDISYIPTVWYLGNNGRVSCDRPTPWPKTGILWWGFSVRTAPSYTCSDYLKTLTVVTVVLVKPSKQHHSSVSQYRRPLDQSMQLVW